MTASSSMPAGPDQGPHRRDETIAVAPETTNRGDGPSFAELGLPKPLTSALARTGITAPFAIQTATIPDALAGRDVLARARTGSGKTLAFGLPMLARLADAGPARSRRPLALVLVPTRELAMQVHDALEPLAHSLQVKLKLVAGGLSMSHQMSALQAGVHLVVATPGRLADLVRRGNCDLHDVRITVIDEADHMADMGFLPEVSAILDGHRSDRSAVALLGHSRRRRRHPDPPLHARPRPPLDRGERRGCGHDGAPGPPGAAEREVPDGSPDRGPRGSNPRLRAHQARGRPGGGAAPRGRGSGLLVARREVAARTEQRSRSFKNGTVPVLVATDVAARGIHVDDINLVLQVDPAGDSKDYLHRSGRTARAGGRGTVLTLVLPHQRREVERLTTGAGVTAAWHQMVRDDASGRQMVDALTGGREPSGIGVAEPRFRTERRSAPNRGPRRPAAAGGGYRGTRDAEHGRPAAHGQHRRGSSDRARQGDRQY